MDFKNLVGGYRLGSLGESCHCSHPLRDVGQLCSWSWYGNSGSFIVETWGLLSQGDCTHRAGSHLLAPRLIFESHRLASGLLQGLLPVREKCLPGPCFFPCCVSTKQIIMPVVAYLGLANLNVYLDLRRP